MALSKTPAGRSALLDSQFAINDLARFILLKANRSLSRKEIFALAGVEADLVVDDLIARGLLSESTAAAILPTTPTSPTQPTPPVLVPAPVPVPEPSPQILPTTPVDLPLSVQPATSTKIEAPAVDAVKKTRALGRRSVMATKMYTLDILNLIRHPETKAHLNAVATSLNEEELMKNVIQAMHFVIAKTSPSYASKVMTRLQEVIPVEYVDPIDVMIFQILAAE